MRLVLPLKLGPSLGVHKSVGSLGPLANELLAVSRASQAVLQRQGCGFQGRSRPEMAFTATDLSTSKIRILGI